VAAFWITFRLYKQKSCSYKPAIGRELAGVRLRRRKVTAKPAEITLVGPALVDLAGYRSMVVRVVLALDFDGLIRAEKHTGVQKLVEVLSCRCRARALLAEARCSFGGRCQVVGRESWHRVDGFILVRARPTMLT